MRYLIIYPAKYKKLKNALEYGRIFITVDTIVSSLRNKELEFKRSQGTPLVESL